MSKLTTPTFVLTRAEVDITHPDILDPLNSDYLCIFIPRQLIEHHGSVLMDVKDDNVSNICVPNALMLVSYLIARLQSKPLPKKKKKGDEDDDEPEDLNRTLRFIGENGQVQPRTRQYFEEVNVDNKGGWRWWIFVNDPNLDLNRELQAHFKQPAKKPDKMFKMAMECWYDILNVSNYIKTIVEPYIMSEVSDAGYIRNLSICEETNLYKVFSLERSCEKIAMEVGPDSHFANPESYRNEHGEFVFPTTVYEIPIDFFSPHYLYVTPFPNTIPRSMIDAFTDDNMYRVESKLVFAQLVTDSIIVQREKEREQSQNKTVLNDLHILKNVISNIKKNNLAIVQKKEQAYNDNIDEYIRLSKKPASNAARLFQLNDELNAFKRNARTEKITEGDAKHCKLYNQSVDELDKVLWSIRNFDETTADYRQLIETRDELKDEIDDAYNVYFRKKVAISEVLPAHEWRKLCYSNTGTMNVFNQINYYINSRRNLSATAKTTFKWYENKFMSMNSKESFYKKAPVKDPALSPFANMIAYMYDLYERNNMYLYHNHLLLAFVVHLTARNFSSRELAFHLLFAGTKSAGKSFLLAMLCNLLTIPGVIEQVARMTECSFMTSSNNNNAVFCCEEMPPAWIGAGTNTSAEQEAMIKDVLAASGNSMVTISIHTDRDTGARHTTKHVAYNQFTFIGGSNPPPTTDNPIRARWAVVTIGQQLRPDKMNNVEEVDKRVAEQARSECAEFHHRMCYFVEHIQSLIFVGVFEDVNIIIADLLFNRVREFMATRGFILSDLTRDIVRYRKLVQILVILQAFYISQCMPSWYAFETPPRLFEMTAARIMRLQDLLVCTKEIAVFAITICAPFMFVDPIESRSILAFYNFSHELAKRMEALIENDEENEEKKFHAAMDGWYCVSTPKMTAARDSPNIDIHVLHLLTGELQRHIGCKMQIQYQEADIFGIFMRLWKSGRTVKMSDGKSSPVIEIKNKSVRLRKEYVQSIVKYKENPEKLAEEACQYALTHAYMPKNETFITGSTYIDTKKNGYIAPHIARVMEVERPDEKCIVLKVGPKSVKCDLNEYAIDSHLRQIGGYDPASKEVDRLFMLRQRVKLVTVYDKELESTDYPENFLKNRYKVNKTFSSNKNSDQYVDTADFEQYLKEQQAQIEKCVRDISNHMYENDDELSSSRKRSKHIV